MKLTSSSAATATSGLIMACLVLLSTGCVSPKPAPLVSGTDLPDFQSRRYENPYRVDPYIQAAISLQSLSYKDALKQLHVLDEDPEGNRKIILCRMLFAPRPNSEFRRPLIGAPDLLGDTELTEWALEPIAIIDGVPFLITIGYSSEGFPEPGEWYLHYCETNCTWNSFHYAVKTRAEKEAALAKLISSPKWKRPLKKSEQEFLANQIK